MSKELMLVPVVALVAGCAVQTATEAHNTERAANTVTAYASPHNRAPQYSGPAPERVKPADIKPLTTSTINEFARLVFDRGEVVDGFPNQKSLVFKTTSGPFTETVSFYPVDAARNLGTLLTGVRVESGIPTGRGVIASYGGVNDKSPTSETDGYMITGGVHKSIVCNPAHELIRVATSLSPAPGNLVAQPRNTALPKFAKSDSVCAPYQPVLRGSISEDNPGRAKLDGVVDSFGARVKFAESKSDSDSDILTPPTRLPLAEAGAGAAQAEFNTLVMATLKKYGKI